MSTKSDDRLLLGPEGGSVPRDLELSIRRECGGGEPLDLGISAKLSDALRRDFSEVRIHTGPPAHEFNRRLSARAFTIGNDIFFGPHAYNPHSTEGLRLIAHELVHVGQQTAGCVGKAGLTVLPFCDESEKEADILAEAALSGASAVPRQAVPRRSPRPRIPAGIVQRRATLIQAANNLINPLTGESNALRPKNCHEAVLGWLLTSLGYPRRWRLIRLAAAVHGVGHPLQFQSAWMWNNIYNPRMQVNQAQVLANALAGDVLCSGVFGTPTHSMVVVGVNLNSVFVRGFNNAGTFIHLIPQPQYMQYDANDRDVAHNNMWNMTGNHPNMFGPATQNLYLVDNAVARAGVAAAFPWEGSQIPVLNGVRWHYNFFNGWRWY